MYPNDFFKIIKKWIIFTNISNAPYGHILWCFGYISQQNPKGCVCLFFLSSSLSLSEEQLSITGLSYQLCQKNDWATTTAIPVAVKHLEENLHVH